VLIVILFYVTGYILMRRTLTSVSKGLGGALGPSSEKYAGILRHIQYCTLVISCSLGVFLILIGMYTYDTFGNAWKDTLPGRVLPSLALQQGGYLASWVCLVTIEASVHGQVDRLVAVHGSSSANNKDNTGASSSRDKVISAGSRHAHVATDVATDVATSDADVM